MPEQEINENELQNYEMPITDLTDDKGNPILSPSTGADIITAVGGVTPERFWMVFMVIISIALGIFTFIGGGYLANEISSKNNEITQLKKELKEGPEETLNRIKKEQLNLFFEENIKSRGYAISPYFKSLTVNNFNTVFRMQINRGVNGKWQLIKFFPYIF